MASRYDENTKARAVRLVREHRDDYDSEWAAIKAISARLGMNAETLRKWVRQAEVDAGEAPGVSTDAARRSASCAANAASSNRRSLSWVGWAVRQVDQDVCVVDGVRDGDAGDAFGAELPV